MGISIVDIRNIAKGLNLSKQDESLLVAALRKREDQISKKIEDANSKAKETLEKAKETYEDAVKTNKFNLLTREAKAIMSYLKIESTTSKDKADDTGNETNTDEQN